MSTENSDRKPPNPPWRAALPDLIWFSSLMIAWDALRELHHVGKPIWDILGPGAIAGLVYALFQFYRSD